MAQPPGIPAEDLHYYHAKFIVSLFPERAIDYIKSLKDQDKVKEDVENRCREIRHKYWDIMKLADADNWDEILRKKQGSNPSSSMLSGQNSPHLSHPLTSSGPRLAFSNPGFTNPVPLPTPPTTASASNSNMRSSLEFITILGWVPVQLTMRESPDNFHYIRTGVLAERLGNVFHAGPSTGSGPKYNTSASGHSVMLPFCRPSPHDSKSREACFYLHDTLEVADVLMDYGFFRPQIPPMQNAFGGPPNVQSTSYNDTGKSSEFSQPYNRLYPQSPGSASHHLSSVTTPPPSRYSGFEMSTDPMRRRTAPQPERSSPTASHTSTASIQRRAPPPVVPRPEVAEKSSTGNIALETNLSDINSSKIGTSFSWCGKKSTKWPFDLCPTGESFLCSLKGVCAKLKVALDRPRYDVEFITISDADEESSHILSLGDSFEEDWPDALEFIQDNRSHRKTEFKIRVQVSDEFSGG